MIFIISLPQYGDNIINEGSVNENVLVHVL